MPGFRAIIIGLTEAAFAKPRGPAGPGPRAGPFQCDRQAPSGQPAATGPYRWGGGRSSV